MVMEHVRDASRAWANMAALLAPGGVALAFHPTLYAPPFVINRLIPETLTAPVLKYFFADRHDGDFPKFPARYDLCRADPAVVEPALSRAGFREVLTAPFWGDRYFRHLPGIQGGRRRAQRARRATRLAAARELRLHDRAQVNARYERGRADSSPRLRAILSAAAKPKPQRVRADAPRSLARSARFMLVGPTRA